MSPLGKLFFFGSIGLINVDGVDERPSSSKKRRWLLVVAVIAVVALVIISAILVWPSSHPSAESILKADDLNTSKPLGTTGWAQITPVTTKSYDSNSPGPAYIERSISAMQFENSTINVSLFVELTEFTSVDKARLYFESQQQEAHDSTNMTVIDVDEGKGFLMIMENPYGNGTALSHSATIYNGGKIVGSVYLPGTGLTDEDYSLITTITDLQLRNI